MEVDPTSAHPSVDLDRLALSLGGERRRSLGELTTYRVGGGAEVFVTIRSVDHLQQVAAVLGSIDIETVVIGRGSNLLVADRGFSGVVLQLSDFATGCDIDESADLDLDEDDVVVEVGAAAPLPIIARRTVAMGLQGFEWAVGVPGSVGGAVRMNAGGHGSDMAASLLDVDVVDLRSGRRERRGATNLGLRFRGSNLTDHDVVVSARLRLRRGDQDQSRRLLDEIVTWRREHQPGGQNAGSVFVNPIPGELAAGELVDRAELRGFRIGSAHVSIKHANFIQVDDGGRADDVRAVIEHVRSEVERRFGVHLRSEIRLIGFSDDRRDP